MGCMEPVEKCSKGAWELFQSIVGATCGWPKHTKSPHGSVEDGLVVE